MTTAGSDLELEQGEESVKEIDSSVYREVLAHLPTGVTVITAHTSDGPSGMAANSVTSVSLDPPLILVCPGKSSTTWPSIREAGAFCVNVMAHHHEDVIRKFALMGADRFEGVEYEDRQAGPGLGEAVAWIECRIENEYDAGDHTIVVARVVAIEAASGVEPLVFFRGQYGSFRSTA